MNNTPKGSGIAEGAVGHGAGPPSHRQNVMPSMEAQLECWLKTNKRASIEGGNLKQAAVLFPLINHGGAYHILFIRRSQRVQDHKGEISFPGGVCEKGDGSPEGTALREALEEIGIRPQDVNVLGMLDDMRTLSTGYQVTPVVGVIPHPYPFAVSPDEVEEIITIPLAHFLDARNGGDEPVMSNGQTYTGPVFKYNGHRIWGATARILMNFLRLWNDLARTPGRESSRL